MNWTPEHIKELAELEEQVKHNKEKIKEHDDKINDLSNVYVALTEVKSETRQVNDKVDRIESDVKEIKDKPVKRYEQIVTMIITGIGGAIIGLILGQIGL